MIHRKKNPCQVYEIDYLKLIMLKLQADWKFSWSEMLPYFFPFILIRKCLNCLNNFSVLQFQNIVALFLLFRCNVLSSAEVKDRFSRTPFEKQFCKDQVDSTAHILFSCPHYISLHKPIYFSLDWSPTDYFKTQKLKILLSGKIRNSHVNKQHLSMQLQIPYKTLQQIKHSNIVGC